MKTITLKTHYGNHIVIANGKLKVFTSLSEAWAFISKERGLTK